MSNLLVRPERSVPTSVGPEPATLWARFFSEGKQAARNGMLYRAPPHITSAQERAAWLAGWCRGFVEAM